MAEANIKRESYCSIIIIIMQSVFRRKKKPTDFWGKTFVVSKKSPKPSICTCNFVVLAFINVIL
jgi:hypothetical protein